MNAVAVTTLGQTFITLDDGHGLRATFSTLGASIFSIEYLGEAMTLTPNRQEDYLKEEIYYGKTIGPIAGRIENSALTLDGATFAYSPNEYPHARHGGKGALSSKRFDYVYGSSSVSFVHEDKEAIYQITYSMQEGHEILVRMLVTPKHPLPLGLTNHCFFCLGDEDLSHLSLQVHAKGFIEVDSVTLVPLVEREILPCLDFNESRSVISTIEDPYLQNSKTKGIDHSLLRSDESPILLENDRFILSIQSDFPCVHLYSDNYEDSIETRCSKRSKRRAIAIEMQDNQCERRIYKELYERYISYRFATKA